MSKFADQHQNDPVVHRAHLGSILNMVSAAIAVLDAMRPSSPEFNWREDLRAMRKDIEARIQELEINER